MRKVYDLVLKYFEEAVVKVNIYKNMDTGKAILINTPETDYKKRIEDGNVCFQRACKTYYVSCPI